MMPDFRSDVDRAAAVLVVRVHQHDALAALVGEVAQRDDHLLLIGRARHEDEGQLDRIEHLAREGVGHERHAVLVDLVLERVDGARGPAVDVSRVVLVHAAAIDLELLVELVAAVEQQRADLVAGDPALRLIQVLEIVARPVGHAVDQRVRPGDRSPHADVQARRPGGRRCKRGGEREQGEQRTGVGVSLHGSLPSAAMVIVRASLARHRGGSAAGRPRPQPGQQRRQPARLEDQEQDDQEAERHLAQGG